MEKTAEQLRREHIALEGDTHGKNKWAILFTVLVMTFMVCLDSTVVTVALPVMQKELGVGLDRIQLVSSVYLLATCVAMLPFGRLGDVRGKVNVFQLGVIVFSVGSLLCGLSASLEVLILARIVQGVGCAAAMANNMGIITESFPARERGRAMGILATFVALGMMCGPVLGGMLVASFPWEGIFLINLPIGVISFIVGLYTLPHVKPEAGERPMSLEAALESDAKPELVKPNLTEINGLLGTSFTTDDVDALREALASDGRFAGIPWVVVSMGAAGSVGFHEGRAFRAKTPAIAAVNATGSGD